MPVTSRDNHYYRIEVEGHLDLSWAGWFGDLTLSQHPAGRTIISGYFTDQAALYRLLIKARDLGLPLVSVYPIEKKEI